MTRPHKSIKLAPGGSACETSGNPTRQRLGILDVSVDVQLKISSYLTPPETSALRETCRSLCSAIDEHRTHIVLHLAHVQQALFLDRCRRGAAHTHKLAPSTIPGTIAKPARTSPFYPPTAHLPQPVSGTSGSPSTPEYRSCILSAFDKWPRLRHVYPLCDIPESLVTRLVQDAISAGRLADLHTLVLSKAHWGTPFRATAVKALVACESALLGAISEAEAVAVLESLNLPPPCYLPSGAGAGGFPRPQSRPPTDRDPVAQSLMHWLTHFSAALSYAGSYDAASRVAALLWHPTLANAAHATLAVVQLARGRPLDAARTVLRIHPPQAAAVAGLVQIALTKLLHQAAAAAADAGGSGSGKAAANAAMPGSAGGSGSSSGVAAGAAGQRSMDVGCGVTRSDEAQPRPEQPQGPGAGLAPRSGSYAGMAAAAAAGAWEGVASVGHGADHDLAEVSNLLARMQSLAAPPGLAGLAEAAAAAPSFAISLGQAVLLAPPSPLTKAFAEAVSLCAVRQPEAGLKVLEAHLERRGRWTEIVRQEMMQEQLLLLGSKEDGMGGGSGGSCSGKAGWGPGGVGAGVGGDGAGAGDLVGAAAGAAGAEIAAPTEQEQHSQPLQRQLAADRKAAMKLADVRRRLLHFERRVEEENEECAAAVSEYINKHVLPAGRTHRYSACLPPGADLTWRLLRDPPVPQQGLRAEGFGKPVDVDMAGQGIQCKARMDAGMSAAERPSSPQELLLLRLLTLLNAQGARLADLEQLAANREEDGSALRASDTEPRRSVSSSTHTLRPSSAPSVPAAPNSSLGASWSSSPVAAAAAAGADAIFVSAALVARYRSTVVETLASVAALLLVGSGLVGRATQLLRAVPLTSHLHRSSLLDRMWALMGASTTWTRSLPYHADIQDEQGQPVPLGADVEELEAAPGSRLVFLETEHWWMMQPDGSEDEEDEEEDNDDDDDDDDDEDNVDDMDFDDQVEEDGWDISDDEAGAGVVELEAEPQAQVQAQAQAQAEPQAQVQAQAEPQAQAQAQAEPQAQAQAEPGAEVAAAAPSGALVGADVAGGVQAAARTCPGARFGGEMAAAGGSGEVGRRGDPAAAALRGVPSGEGAPPAATAEDAVMADVGGTPAGRLPAEAAPAALGGGRDPVQAAAPAATGIQARAAPKAGEQGQEAAGAKTGEYALAGPEAAGQERASQQQAGAQAAAQAAAQAPLALSPQGEVAAGAEGHPGHPIHCVPAAAPHPDSAAPALYAPPPPSAAPASIPAPPAPPAAAAADPPPVPPPPPPPPAPPPPDGALLEEAEPRFLDPLEAMAFPAGIEGSLPDPEEERTVSELSHAVRWIWSESRNTGISASRQAATGGYKAGLPHPCCDFRAHPELVRLAEDVVFTVLEGECDGANAVEVVRSPPGSREVWLASLAALRAACRVSPAVQRGALTTVTTMPCVRARLAASITVAIVFARQGALDMAAAAILAAYGSSPRWGAASGALDHHGAGGGTGCGAGGAEPMFTDGPGGAPPPLPPSHDERMGFGMHISGFPALLWACAHLDFALRMSGSYVRACHGLPVSPRRSRRLVVDVMTTEEDARLLAPLVRSLSPPFLEWCLLRVPSGLSPTNAARQMLVACLGRPKLPVPWDDLALALRQVLCYSKLPGGGSTAVRVREKEIRCCRDFGVLEQELIGSSLLLASIVRALDTAQDAAARNAAAGDGGPEGFLRSDCDDGTQVDAWEDLGDSDDEVERLIDRGADVLHHAAAADGDEHVDGGGGSSSVGPSSRGAANGDASAAERLSSAPPLPRFQLTSSLLGLCFERGDALATTALEVRDDPRAVRRLRRVPRILRDLTAEARLAGIVRHSADAAAASGSGGSADAMSPSYGEGPCFWRSWQPGLIACRRLPALLRDALRPDASHLVGPIIARMLGSFMFVDLPYGVVLAVASAMDLGVPFLGISSIDIGVAAVERLCDLCMRYQLAAELSDGYGDVTARPPPPPRYMPRQRLAQGCGGLGTMQGREHTLPLRRQDPGALLGAHTSWSQAAEVLVHAYADCWRQRLAAAESCLYAMLRGLPVRDRAAPMAQIFLAATLGAVAAPPASERAGIGAAPAVGVRPGATGPGAAAAAIASAGAQGDGMSGPVKVAGAGAGAGASLVPTATAAARIDVDNSSARAAKAAAPPSSGAAGGAGIFGPGLLLMFNGLSGGLRESCGPWQIQLADMAALAWGTRLREPPTPLPGDAWRASAHITNRARGHTDTADGGSSDGAAGTMAQAGLAAAAALAAGEAEVQETGGLQTADADPVREAGGGQPGGPSMAPQPGAPHGTTNAFCELGGGGTRTATWAAAVEAEAGAGASLPPAGGIGTSSFSFSDAIGGDASVQWVPPIIIRRFDPRLRPFTSGRWGDRHPFLPSNITLTSEPPVGTDTMPYILMMLTFTVLSAMDGGALRWLVKRRRAAAQARRLLALRPGADARKAAVVPASTAAAAPVAAAVPSGGGGWGPSQTQEGRPRHGGGSGGGNGGTCSVGVLSEELEDGRDVWISSAAILGFVRALEVPRAVFVTLLETLLLGVLTSLTPDSGHQGTAATSSGDAAAAAPTSAAPRPPPLPLPPPLPPRPAAAGRATGEEAVAGGSVGHDGPAVTHCRSSSPAANGGPPNRAPPPSQTAPSARLVPSPEPLQPPRQQQPFSPGELSRSSPSQFAFLHMTRLVAELIRDGYPGEGPPQMARLAVEMRRVREAVEEAERELRRRQKQWGGPQQQQQQGKGEACVGREFGDAVRCEQERKQVEVVTMRMQACGAVCAPGCAAGAAAGGDVVGVEECLAVLRLVEDLMEDMGWSSVLFAQAQG